MTDLNIAAFFTDIAAQPRDTNASLAINITTFLTLLCWVFLAGFILSLLSKKIRTIFYDTLGDKVFFLAWLVPTVAMVFSLYFSEFLGWRPCPLCWYQRGFIYSLSLVTLIYYFKRVDILRRIGYVLATLGPLVSIYHVLLERYPTLEGGPSCDPDNPCASPWFYSMGFLTTAGMALTAAVTTGVLLYMSQKVQAENKATKS
jgi:disulfide bond formation protein DsbB